MGVGSKCPQILTLNKLGWKGLVLGIPKMYHTRIVVSPKATPHSSYDTGSVPPFVCFGCFNSRNLYKSLILIGHWIMLLTDRMPKTTYIELCNWQMEIYLILILQTKYLNWLFIGKKVTDKQTDEQQLY